MSLNKYQNMYKLLTFVFLMDQYLGTKTPLRIYGGEDVNPDEYPYVVRLEIQHVATFPNNTIIKKHDHLCTSSALSPTWTVTAAHCISDLGPHIMGSYNLSKLVIRYGSVHSSPWKNYTLSDVVYTVMHPLFSFTYGLTNHNSMMTNDIALVKTQPILLRSYMKLSAVDYTTMYGHEAVFAGYGVTTKKNSKGKFVTDDTLQLRKPLQVVNILIIKCPKNERTEPSICLAKKCGVNSMACGGDSGGPLIHTSGIVGVLSNGEASGYCLDELPKISVNYVGVIIPISPYLEWIRSYVNT